MPRLMIIIVGGLLSPSLAGAQPAPDMLPFSARAGDMLATGNEWIALPEIRTSDGALVTFNTVSMRDRSTPNSSSVSRPAVHATRDLRARVSAAGVI